MEYPPKIAYGCIYTLHLRYKFKLFIKMELLSTISKIALTNYKKVYNDEWLALEFSSFFKYSSQSCMSCSQVRGGSTSGALVISPNSMSPVSIDSNGNSFSCNVLSICGATWGSISVVGSFDVKL